MDEIKVVIRERIEAGYSDVDILKEMSEASYPEEMAKRLLNEVRAEPTQVAPNETSIPAEQSAETNPPEEEKVEKMVKTEASKLSEPSNDGVSEKSSVTKIVVFVLLGLILIGGVAYGAFFGGFAVIEDKISGLFSKAPYETPGEMMAGLAESMAGLKSYSFNNNYGLFMEPKETDTKLLSSVQEIPSDIEDSTAFWPDKGMAQFTMSGLIDRRPEDYPNFDMTASVQVSAEPIIFDAAAGLRAVDGKVYGQVIDLPTAFMGNMPYGIPLKTWVLLANDTSGFIRNEAPTILPMIISKNFPSLANNKEFKKIGGVLQTLVMGGGHNAKGLNNMAAVAQATDLLQTEVLTEEQIKLRDDITANLIAHPIFAFAEEPKKVKSDNETLYEYGLILDYDNLVSFATLSMRSVGEYMGESERSINEAVDEFMAEFPPRSVVENITQFFKITVTVRADGSIQGLLVEAKVGLNESYPNQLRLHFESTIGRQDDSINITIPDNVHPKTLEEMEEERRKNMYSGVCFPGDILCESLLDAKGQGTDASIKQTISNMRSQAELSYNKNNFSYSAVCEDPNIVFLAKSILEITNGYSSETNIIARKNGAAGMDALVCNTTGENYAIATPLVSKDNKMWCVDSSGFSGEVAPDVLSSGSDTSCR